MRTLSKPGIFALLFLACCAAPVRDYTVEQIQAVQDFDELMQVQAAVAEPRFARAGRLAGKELSQADWDAFADMATRLTATVKEVIRFSQGPEFDRFNAQLGDQAALLRGHVEARRAKETLGTVLDMRQTCAACHKQFR